MFIPFAIHQTSDDDGAPMTRGQFKQLNEKLDSILASSQSASNYESMLKSYRATIEMLTKVNEKVLEESTKAIQASEKTISETTAKVEKLHDEVMKFMVEFRCSSDENTENVNKVITSLVSTLQTKKEALSHVRSKIKLGNTELNTFVVSMIDNFRKTMLQQITSWIN